MSLSQKPIDWPRPEPYQLIEDRQDIANGGDAPSPLETLRAMHARGVPWLSLAEFVVGAWHVVEPTTPLVWNWHLEVICNHVEAVLLGPELAREKFGAWVQNLLINVPPGTMKSLIVSVFAPAWVWLWKPSWRAVFASANPRVALRDSVRCRDLLDSDWYEKTFRPGWSLAEDQNAKGNYKNSKGGFRLAISVNAKVTGDRADALFLDDPLDAADAPSKVARDGVIFWLDQAFSNRVAQPKTATRIMIMQRLHEDDPSGHVLASGEYEHLCLPMHFEPGGPSTRETFIGFRDPRTVDGELLFPQRFDLEVLAAERKRLGSAGYAGQMQQRPVPSSGNRFQREWWRFWSSDGIRHARPRGCTEAPAKVLPAKGRFESVISSWDCTFKGSDGSDFVVGVVVGISGADRYVLALFRAKAGFADTVRAIKQQRDDWHPWEILIEDKANGSAVVETLSAEIPAVIAVNPQGGKESRAAVLEPQVEAGNWYLPEGATWLEEFVEEFAAFPLGRHDDQVDAVSQAAIRLVDPEIATARALLGG